MSNSSTDSADLARDWAVPRAAAAFTGYIGGDSKGPGGSVLLCVANTPIPCTLEARDKQRIIQFTVLNVREKGWLKAPWKKATASHKAGSKAPRDDNAKELFEMGEWAKNDVTMERVGKSVIVYSFAKDGLSRGDRADDKVSCVMSGQTIRVVLHDHMYEEKKGGASAGVFPVDTTFIPAFTVIEVVITAGNTKSYEEGFGINVARIRTCPFTLYSMLGPLGLGLTHPSYEASVADAEASLQLNPGLQKILETKNTGFCASVTPGAYITKYSEDSFRLVGPKEDPSDPLSRHLDVVQGGGVFAITISKADLLRFTNAVVVDGDEENALIYAQCVLDLAASAGALSCYVVHNEYLMRKDPNGIPYLGAPLIDTNKLLETVSLPLLLEKGSTRFPLRFPVVNMDAPFLAVDCARVLHAEQDAAPPLPCPDLVLASEDHAPGLAYPLSLGDATDDEFMRILFMPKSSRSGLHGTTPAAAGLERQDYRALKRARVGGA